MVEGGSFGLQAGGLVLPLEPGDLLCDYRAANAPIVFRERLALHRPTNFLRDTCLNALLATPQFKGRTQQTHETELRFKI